MKVLTRLLIVQLAAIAIASGLVWYVPPLEGRRVRQLDVAGGQSGILAGPKLEVFSSAAELRRAYPQGLSPPSAAADFTREKLVHLVWSADGFVNERRSTESTSPIYSQLVPHVRLAGNRVLFSVEEPRSTGRVFSQILHDDWFTVPKSAEPALVSQHQTNLLDASYWLFALMGLAFPLAAIAEWISAGRKVSAERPW